jgi:hypothetical protein
MKERLIDFYRVYFTISRDLHIYRRADIALSMNHRIIPNTMKIFTRIWVWSVKTEPFGFLNQNLRFCSLEHLQNIIISLFEHQIMRSIYSFLSSQRGFHHGGSIYLVWVHFLVVSSTALFLECNSTKLSEKNVHNIENMSVCLACEIYKAGLHLKILTIL